MSARPRNASVLPAERAEANSRSSASGKAPLLEAADQLDADRAGGTDDRDDRCGGGWTLRTHVAGGSLRVDGMFLPERTAAVKDRVPRRSGVRNPSRRRNVPVISRFRGCYENSDRLAADDQALARFKALVEG